MWETLRAWWIVYVGIVGARAVLQLAVGRVYREVRDRLDRRIPDDLPIHAGQWVRDQLRALELHDEIDVVSAAGESAISDSYWPSPRLIHLAERTFFKRDPAFWAIGAHELGHALVQRRSGALELLFTAARLSAHVSALGGIFLLVNIAYVNPWLTDASWWLYVVGLGALGVVLVDEALATGLGLRMLGADERMTPRYMRAARHHLAAAYATYVAGFFGGLLVLVEWTFVQGMLAERPPMAWEALPESMALDKALAVGLMIVAASRLIGQLGSRTPSLRPETDEEKEKENLRTVGAGCAASVRRVVVIALVGTLLWRLWNVPLLAAGWPVVVALAAVPVVPWVLVVPVMCTVLAVMVVLIPVLAIWGTAASDPEPEPVKGSPEELEASAARIEEAKHSLQVRPPAVLVGVGLLQELTYLPLAVVVLLA